MFLRMYPHHLKDGACLGALPAECLHGTPMAAHLYRVSRLWSFTPYLEPAESRRPPGDRRGRWRRLGESSTLLECCLVFVQR